VKDVGTAVDFTSPHNKEMFHNPTYEAMWTPVAGPSHPLKSDPLAPGGTRNMLTGFVETYGMGDIQFDKEFHSFNTFGYASNPSHSGLVGIPKEKPVAMKRKGCNNPIADEFMGPWAPFPNENPSADQIKKQNPKATLDEASSADETKATIEDEDEKSEEQKPEEKIIEAEEEEDEKKKTRKVEQEWLRAMKKVFFTEQNSEITRAGLISLHLPSSRTPITSVLFPRNTSTLGADTPKEFQQFDFFPTFGHLMLSASMDTTIKLWDVYTDRSCIRTFIGHTKAVRDICFNYDGSRFLSASYDRQIKLWDAETGTCIARFCNGKIPYCVKFNPDPERQHLFLAGCSDKKIIQWDVRTEKIVQEYDQHLGAVNTITFIDNNRRFVSSSDDKSIRVWEWNIPVVIKYISEPHMHSMPSIAVHPNGSWFVGQSLDNQILVYSTRDRFKLNKKKRFIGHLVAGYACQVNFSPNGRFLMSGDSEGKLWFWDWKSCKVFRTLRCHSGVCIGAEWHPIEPSKVATCGWDGTIKYWD